MRLRSTRAGRRHAWISVAVCGLALLVVSPPVHGQIRVGVQVAKVSDSLSVQINSGSSLPISSLAPGAVNTFSGGRFGHTSPLCSDTGCALTWERHYDLGPPATS